MFFLQKRLTQKHPANMTVTIRNSPAVKAANQQQRSSTPVSQQQRISTPVSQPQRSSIPVSQPQRSSTPVSQPQRCSTPVNLPQRSSTPIICLKGNTPASSDDEQRSGKQTFKKSRPLKLTLTNAEKLKEKIRLQKLALEYEIKIQKMKLKHSNIQRQTLLKKALTPKKKLSPKSPEDTAPSKSVLCLEKIELGSDPIDLTNDTNVGGETRRKSLLEMNPSTKPDLELKFGHPTGAKVLGKEKNFEVNMPEGKNLLKVIKMQVIISILLIVFLSLCLSLLPLLRLGLGRDYRQGKFMPVR